MRFVMAGVVLVFVGFISLAAFAPGYVRVLVQAEEFDECYEYGDAGSLAAGGDADVRAMDAEGGAAPIAADCGELALRHAWPVALGAALLAGGAACAVKGWRGTWDQDVKEGDMVGPGRGGKPRS